jgi:formimidoylglutamase
MKLELPHLDPPGLVVNALRGDPEERRAHRWLQGGEIDELAWAVLGVPYDGASVVRSGARHGPDAVRSALRNYSSYSTRTGVLVSELAAADIGDLSIVLTDMQETFARLTSMIRSLAKSQINTLVVGGDHSITWPIVAGLAQARPGRRLGIIHFDAHHDLREGHFGSISSGVPFRKILELPDSPLEGSRLVQIGIGELVNSPAHAAYAREQGVTVITNAEAWEVGLDRCIERALEIAGDGADDLYVSVDIDCVDQSQAPGTAAPNPNGLDARDLYRAVRTIARDPRMIGADVVEVAPTLEPGDLTSNVGAMLVLSFLAGIAER